MALSITDLKKGTLISLDGEPYRVVEYSQKVMGRGGSIVNVKIKSLVSGKVLGKTYKGSDKLERAEVNSKPVQYLYGDGQDYHFMDPVSFEQFSLPVAGNEDLGSYMKEGFEASAQLYNGQPIGIELPKNVDLAVTEAESAVKGDTATAITKNATLETGLVVKVPAFIKVGDVLSIDTATGTYRERKK